ncbi:MAG: PhoPQ-activated pathogenicity-related family protein [Planctomycetaceae bacterium]|nr:PhoPQ-activated pathogenicity-related family protein [Planctomycetaceae bacterium]
MKLRLPFACALCLVFLVIGSLGLAEDPLPRRTALDDYIQKPDESYSWKVVSETSVGGVKAVVIDMTSQTWLSKEHVDRPVWQHWVTMAIPENVTSDIGFLFIGGGRNGSDPPAGPEERILSIAKATGTVVAELKQVPNQPLVFHNDGQPRVEDDLIGYCWDQFLKTGDPTWAPRNAMVKSAVRAMDTMTAVMASDIGGGKTVDRFVVAGGSKRGWTTWLTGALDERVVAIVPIVIDVLNTRTSMEHHFAAYGFWAPAIGDYVTHQLMQRMEEPRLAELYRLVDPYFYRHRLTMPKLILNAAGDQFFLPDSSKFYWNELRGEKYLRYVPNGDHGLNRTDAMETLIAFYSMILNDHAPPEYLWTEGEDGSIRVMTTTTPKEVRLWQATNEEARDFRLETLGPKYTSTVLEPNESGVYVANVPDPSHGWTAYFVELTYDVGGPFPLKVTTNIRVKPDTLPFKGKRSDLPTSVTVIGIAPDEAAAQTAIAEAESFIKQQGFAAGELSFHCDGKRCYFNWKPTGDLETGAKIMAEWMARRKFNGFAFQLESGPEITLPPRSVD